MIDASRHRTQQIRNTVQGLLLLAAMVLVFGVVAWLLFGTSGLVVVAIGALVVGLLRPRIPTAWVLRMYGAQPLPSHAAPELHRVVQVLAERAGLETTPALYYIASPMANAFATGTRKDGVIGVTDGILRMLPGRQLIGVLAHEISHIRAGDMRITNLSDSLARFTQGLAYLGILLVFLTMPLTLAGDVRPLLVGLALTILPTISTVLQMALSRSREYDADLDAAALTGDPEGLAAALETLERAEGAVWERLMIPRRHSPDATLLRSHPPTAERARRLRQLTPAAGRHQHADTSGLLDTYPPVRTRPRLRPPGIRW